MNSHDSAPSSLSFPGVSGVSRGARAKAIGYTASPPPHQPIFGLSPPVRLSHARCCCDVATGGARPPHPSIAGARLLAEAGMHPEFGRDKESNVNRIQLRDLCGAHHHGGGSPTTGNFRVPHGGGGGCLSRSGPALVIAGCSTSKPPHQYAQNNGRKLGDGSVDVGISRSPHRQAMMSMLPRGTAEAPKSLLGAPRPSWLLGSLAFLAVCFECPLKPDETTQLDREPTRRCFGCTPRTWRLPTLPPRVLSKSAIDLPKWDIQTTADLHLSLLELDFAPNLRDTRVWPKSGIRMLSVVPRGLHM
ncbi:hypothetical protein B0T16DRAFT_72245 [Cercophora newfieldiana]|uniref:Uncharacterized protein n=1 Tax=Cercophora newfieldiana TaxID=92897 RepID=A0AA40CVT7_9PEZI|nr:hypothetical protein B0T16DRAFT_72245 [Cercophora newfieldiana]